MAKGTTRDLARAESEPLVVTEVEQLKALAHPLRQRLLERFAECPRTTKQVADQLQEKPTRLYHHVHILEAAGLLRLVETRPKRGTVEKYYASVASRIRIDPRLLTGGETGLPIASAGLGVVDGLLANVRAELAELATLADPSDPLGSAEEEAVLVQVEVRGDADRIHRARARIDDLLSELEEDLRGSDLSTEQGTAHRLVLAWYPLPTSSTSRGSR